MLSLRFHFQLGWLDVEAAAGKLIRTIISLPPSGDTNIFWKLSTHSKFPSYRPFGARHVSSIHHLFLLLVTCSFPNCLRCSTEHGSKTRDVLICLAFHLYITRQFTALFQPLASRWPTNILDCYLTSTINVLSFSPKTRNVDSISLVGLRQMAIIRIDYRFKSDVLKRLFLVTHLNRVFE